MDLRNYSPALFVKDAQVARDFYEILLGLKVKMVLGGTNIIFEGGLTIWQIADDNIILQKLGAENVFNRHLTSRFEIYFETEHLDDVYKTLKEANVRFLHEIHTEQWGQRGLRFYDPDGHLIEVGEAMHVFIHRIYQEENHDPEATAQRTFTPIEIVKEIISNNQ